MCGMLGGCTQDFNKKEVNEIDMIRVLGIDYEEEQYVLTALYGIGGADTINEGIETMEARGNTLFEAFDQLKKDDKKEVTFAYTNYYLLGEGAAKKGIENIVNYLMNDETIKVNALLYVIKEDQAKLVMEDAKEAEIMIQDDLKALVEKQLDRITRNENTLLWLFEEIENGRESTIIPYLLYKEQKFTVGGYTAFLKNRLIAYLDEDTSLGIDLIKGIVKNCSIALPDGTGIMIHGVKTEVSPSLQSNCIQVRVKLQFDSVLRSIPYEQQTVDESLRQKIKKEQTKYMLELLNQTVLAVQTIHVDAFRLGEKLEKNRTIWSALSNHQDDYFEYTKFDFTIESRITKSNILEGWR